MGIIYWWMNEFPRARNSTGGSSFVANAALELTLKKKKTLTAEIKKCPNF